MITIRKMMASSRTVSAMPLYFARLISAITSGGGGPGGAPGGGPPAVSLSSLEVVGTWLKTAIESAVR